MSQRTIEFVETEKMVMATVEENYGRYIHEIVLMFEKSVVKNEKNEEKIYLMYKNGTETNNKITLSYDEKMINMMRPGFLDEIRSKYNEKV